MQHYYLLNGTVKKGKKMPERQNYKLKITFEASYNDWKDSLQSCEIDESEFDKINLCLSENNTIYIDNNNPIDITDIVSSQVICNADRCDGECIECTNMILKVEFKQPTEKQVESDAVEFAEWIALSKWKYNGNTKT